MGMYDTINGEQVKCFPVSHFYKGEMNYSCGSLKYYGDGSKVPYKTLDYNYTKNFNIIDLNNFSESDPIIIHKIRNGKVEETKHENFSDDDFGKDILCVGYMGDKLIINSLSDLYSYMEDKAFFLALSEHAAEKVTELNHQIMNSRKTKKAQENKDTEMVNQLFAEVNKEWNIFHKKRRSYFDRLLLKYMIENTPEEDRKDYIGSFLLDIDLSTKIAKNYFSKGPIRERDYDIVDRFYDSYNKLREIINLNEINKLGWDKVQKKRVNRILDRAGKLRSVMLDRRK